MMQRIWSAAAALCLTMPVALADEKPAGWLHDAGSDAERISLIQGQFGGFGKAMWEVGHRYRAMHRALRDENYELARYQLEEMEEVIEDALVRRPKRQKNAEKFMPEGLWKQVDEAFESEDEGRVRRAFASLREGCMNCHEAEEMGFLNRQPMFELKLSGDRKRRDRD